MLFIRFSSRVFKVQFGIVDTNTNTLLMYLSGPDALLCSPIVSKAKDNMSTPIVSQALGVHETGLHFPLAEKDRCNIGLYRG